VLLILAALVWLQRVGASSSMGHTNGALLILVAGAVLTLASAWLAVEYGIKFYLHNYGPQLPYMIRDLEL
jgi:hypothetical protein